MTHCFRLQQWADDPAQCLYDWQTIIAGILALAAAMLTAALLRSQIKQAENLQKAQLNRIHSAEMAVFGLTLAQTCESIATAQFGCARLLSSTLPSDIISGSEKLNIPERFINDIYRFMSSTDNPKIVSISSMICRNIQIRQSRQIGEGVRDYTLAEAIIDLAAIYVLCETLLLYVRRKQQDIPKEINWEDAGISLEIIGLRPHRYPEIDKLLKLRVASSTKVWSLDDR